MSNIATPPLIPASAKFATLEVDVAKINSIVGDSLSSINTWKGSVTIASTANLTLSAVQTIDGVAIIVDDTVLVKNQSTASQNGLYTVKSGAWVRSTNLIAGSNAAGIAVFVNEGTVNADTIWVCTDDVAAAVVGTDALTFVSLTSVIGPAGANTQVQFNNAGALAGDAGLTFTVGSGTLEATIITDGTLSVTAGAITAIDTLTETKADTTATASAATSSAGSGTITTVSLSTAAQATATQVVVTNTKCTATSVVHATMLNYSGTTGTPIVNIDTVAAGSFNIVISNSHATGALNGILKIGYSLI
jgi:hypothetical protein